MNSKPLVCLAVMMTFLLSAASAAFAVPAEPAGHKRYFTENNGEVLAASESTGCEIIKQSKRITSFRCPANVSSTAGLREDVKIVPFGIDSDRNIGADVVWDWNITGVNRLVAVIDTGIAYNHPEINDSYIGGWNFVDNNNDTFDRDGHGTAVIGVITSKGKVRSEMIGVAPDAKILALKALSGGEGVMSDAINAIYYAVDGPDGVYGTDDDFHPDAISMSFGTLDIYNDSDCDAAYPELVDAVNYAVSKGVVMVAAAGNNGINGISAPGCISNVIGVGAIDEYWDLWMNFSGTGNSLDITAPGRMVQTTWVTWNGHPSYARPWGTSFAAPHVSGAVALMRQANPNISVPEIKNILYTTAKDLGDPGWDKYFGWGRLNVSAAIDVVEPPVHDVSVSSVSLPAQAMKESVVSINVTVKNLGNRMETFNVAVSDVTDSVSVGVQSVRLAIGASGTPTFNYNTTVSSIGNHIIKAEAIVTEDGNIQNNAGTAMMEIIEPPWYVHDVAVSSISMPSMAVAGQNVSINATVKNLGNRPENFTLTVSDDTASKTIGSQSVILAAGMVKGLIFKFDTSASYGGIHTIRTEASQVPRENNTANNAMTRTINIIGPQQPQKMHVSQITMAIENSTYLGKRASATVYVVNEAEVPVQGASVNGIWSGVTKDSEFGMTDTFGKIKLYSDWKKNATGTFTFTVTKVAKYSGSYDPSSNSVTSGSIPA